MTYKNKKKSSIQITFALIGTVALSSCGEDGTRPIYNSKSDCVGEWGEKDCEEIPRDSTDRMHGIYYGRFFSHGTSYSRTLASRSTSIAHVSRGGFGSSSGSHSSGGRS